MLSRPWKSVCCSFAAHPVREAEGHAAYVPDNPESEARLYAGMLVLQQPAWFDRIRRYRYHLWATPVVAH